MCIRDRFNSVRRLDLLQELVDDKDITEIMVNGAGDIFYEKYGHMRRWDKAFESNEKLEDVIQQIVAGANRQANEDSPLVDARLAQQPGAAGAGAGIPVGAEDVRRHEDAPGIGIGGGVQVLFQGKGPPVAAVLDEIAVDQAAACLLYTSRCV